MRLCCRRRRCRRRHLTKLRGKLCFTIQGVLRKFTTNSAALLQVRKKSNQKAEATRKLQLKSIGLECLKLEVQAKIELENSNTTKYEVAKRDHTITKAFANMKLTEANVAETNLDNVTSAREFAKGKLKPIEAKVQKLRTRVAVLKSEVTEMSKDLTYQVVL